MGKTAFMFPGQGAQVTGMGKAFYETFQCSRECFEMASKVVDLDIADLIFNEEKNENLNKTEYTQIALYVTEVAILRALEEKGLTSDVNIGLSLGEYSAVTASGALKFEDGCSLVRKRGLFMEQAVPNGLGSMAAILGMSGEAVEEVLSNGDYKEVCIANYNCPGQIVISGEKKSVQKACEALKESGAKRAVELNVSGPFHSPMLIKAGEQLGNVLKNVEFDEVKVPYVANLTADYVRDSSNISELLTKQVYSSVRFEQSVRMLIKDGVDTFVEIGPGKTLAGFIKKIARDMDVDAIIIKNVEKPEDLESIGLTV